MSARIEASEPLMPAAARVRRNYFLFLGAFFISPVGDWLYRLACRSLFCR